MKKLLPAIILFFAVSSGAQAGVISDFLLDPIGVGGANETLGNALNNNRKSQTFRTTGAHTTLDISFDVKKFGTPSDIIVSLYDNAQGPSYMPTSIPLAGWNTATLLENSVTNSYQRFTVNLTGPALTANAIYTVVFEPVIWDNAVNNYNLKRHTVDFGGIDGNRRAWTEGETGQDWGANNFSEFSMLVADGVPPTTPNEIINPTNLSTVTERPFNVSGTCDAGANSELSVVIIHKLTGGIMEPLQVQCIADTWNAEGMGLSLWNDVYKITLLPQNLGLALDTIEFTYSVTLNPIVPPPSIDNDLGCDTGETIADAFCTVLAWLFIPDDLLLSKFGDLWQKVKNKPPIGYITGGLVSWGSISQGTSANVLEGTASLSDYFDPIKIAFASLLWLLLLVWIIRRIGNMRI